LKNIKQFLHNRYTVVVAPHQASRSMTFNIGTPFLVMTSLCLLGFSAFGLFTFLEGSSILKRLANQELLESKVKTLANQVVAMRQIAQGATLLEKDLRYLLAQNSHDSVLTAKNRTENLDSDTLGDLLIGKLSDTALNKMENEKQDFIDQSKGLMTLAGSYLAYQQNQEHRELSLPSEWPTLGALTSTYGIRTNPFNFERAGEYHRGVDLANIEGTPIRAAADGIVRSAGWMGGYGNGIILDHGFGYTTLYGHASALAVSAGSFVHRGDVIAYMGSTGRSTGSHLHFEVWQDGKPVNPLQFVSVDKLIDLRESYARQNISGVGGVGE